jgi:ABC-type nitrate/sulfonate/bicarbonate transport system substrate-binding protein
LTAHDTEPKPFQVLDSIGVKQSIGPDPGLSTLEIIQLMKVPKLSRRSPVNDPLYAGKLAKLESKMNQGNRTLRRRAGKAVGLMVLGALFLSGCASAGQEGSRASAASGQGGTKVVIGLLDTGMTTLPPMRLADDLDLQKKYGLDVELKFYSKQALDLAMASGEIDTTITTPSVLATLAARGVDVQVIGTVASDASIVFLGKGPAITSANDMKGTRIATLGSSGTWRTLQAQLDSKFGLAASDYEVVNSNDVSSAAAQAAAGTADYAMAWEPFATQAMQKSGNLHVVLKTDMLKDYVSWQFIVGAQKKLDERVKANLVKALAESALWIEENREKADAKYGAALKYEPGVIKNVLDAGLLSFDVDALTAQDTESIKTDLRLVADKGDGRVPDEKFFFTGK